MPPRFRVISNGDFFFEEPDCRLSCLHCSHGIKKRLRRTSRIHRAVGKLAYLADSIARRGPGAFEELVADAPQVCLSGYDILESREIFELLEICSRHRKKIRIISPGLRLSDPLFAQRLAEYRPEILLTCLSRRPETYDRMTGYPGTQRLVEQALENLRKLNLSFSVNFVATSLNCPELCEVAAYLFESIGINSFTLLNFFPDRVHYLLDARTQERFVSFDELNRRLLDLVAKYRGSQKQVCLWGVPPCKLNPEILTSGFVNFSVRDSWDESYRTYRHPNCRECRFREKCFFVSAYYQNAYPRESYDHLKVDRLFSSLVY